MDAVGSFARALCLTVALAASSPVAFAADAPTTETPVQRQQHQVDALRAVAQAASPSNVPGREELVKAMIVAIAIADPALLPDGSAGLTALGDLRTVCSNAAQAGRHLITMAQATDDAINNLTRMSLAVNRVQLMITACSARELDLYGRAILARPDPQPTAEERAAMQVPVAMLPPAIANVVLGATLTDLNPNSRARIAVEAPPVLREALAAMSPTGKAAVMDAVQQRLAPPEKDGHIDHAARDPLLEVLRGKECSAACRVLSGG